MCRCLTCPIMFIWVVISTILGLFFTTLLIGAMVHFRDYIALATPFVIFGVLLSIIYTLITGRTIEGHIRNLYHNRRVM